MQILKRPIIEISHVHNKNKKIKKNNETFAVGIYIYMLILLWIILQIQLNIGFNMGHDDGYTIESKP